jgi:hypothetical protein
MSMHCVLDSTRQVSWQGQLPEGDTTSANLFNELVEPWNMMDWRPFSLRHPGLLTATDSPQPSEHALSLQNCAHKSKSLVVTLPCSLPRSLRGRTAGPALTWRDAARAVIKKVVESMMVKVVLLGSVVDVVCEVDCALRGEDDGLYIQKKNGNFNYAQYHLPS